jgi:hypothetical protein
MVEVEILGQVITHQYGVLNSGDVLRTSAEFAKHLVEDCGAARYRSEVSAPAVVAVEAEVRTAAEPAPQAKSTRGKK